MSNEMGLLFNMTTNTTKPNTAHDINPASPLEQKLILSMLHFCDGKLRSIVYINLKLVTMQSPVTLHVDRKQPPDY